MMKIKQSILDKFIKDELTVDSIQRITLAIIAIELGYKDWADNNLEHYDKVYISQLDFIKFDFMTTELSSKSSIIGADDEYNDLQVEAIMKDIRKRFKDINPDRAGSLKAMKLRYAAINKKFGIGIREVKEAVIHYLENLGDPEKLLTAERFFYRGPISRLDSQLLRTLDTLKDDKDEREIARKSPKYTDLL